MTANEFARPIRLDTLGEVARYLRLAAEPEERAALARRFGLAAIDRLEVEAAVRRTGDTVFAEGRLGADVVQTCVATGEPLPVSLDEPFALRFAPAETGPPVEEVELSEADCDTLFYDAGAVDLGEAAAETLLLALDPFPRSAHADAALKQVGVVGEEDVGPFAALKALKDKLRG